MISVVGTGLTLPIDVEPSPFFDNLSFLWSAIPQWTAVAQRTTGALPPRQLKCAPYRQSLPRRFSEIAATTASALREPSKTDIIIMKSGI
jgi:hypothetical protein